MFVHESLSPSGLLSEMYAHFTILINALIIYLNPLYSISAFSVKLFHDNGHNRRGDEQDKKEAE